MLDFWVLVRCCFGNDLCLLAYAHVLRWQQRYWRIRQHSKNHRQEKEKKIPNPETTASTLGPMQQRILDRLTGADQRPVTKADLLELQAKVEELVAMLKPPSSVIVTGGEAMRAFSELQRHG